jgi:2,7-dihydroxy-5-methyl-1-naphthoate 7-O-methyltransferase
VSSDNARERLSELSDFAAPWAVWIAATLRLADHIEAGARSPDELAERAAAEPDALARLLRYLVARGVFEGHDGVYSLNEVSRLLLDEGGWRQWLDLDDAPGIWAESWTSLLEAVRTGSPGRDEGWYEGEMVRTGRAESFDALMAAQVKANAVEIAEVYDWAQVERVVDIGGGSGELLRTLLAAHSHLRGTLFDLPRVVSAAEPAERLDTAAGDFFDDPLPRGDAYVLSQIVHGFADDGAARILSRCIEAGGGHPTILLVEQVISEPPTADEASFDLFMFTLGGGRQRTLDEFRALAESLDLTVGSAQSLTTGNSLVELGS